AIGSMRVSKTLHLGSSPSGPAIKIIVAFSKIIMGNLIKNIVSLPKKLVNFFRLTIVELEKDKWLSRIQTFKYTFIVVVLLIASAIAILLLDRGFLFIRNLVL